LAFPFPFSWTFFAGCSWCARAFVEEEEYDDDDAPPAEVVEESRVLDADFDGFALFLAKFLSSSASRTILPLFNTILEVKRGGAFLLIRQLSDIWKKEWVQKKMSELRDQ
jgi:hypothetical protein